ncbi:uncharacterized protein F5Z01DRAFT_94492 [Emericellopsis atlantica]|uniref:Integral membrane protein n=1 Tax=Emericellopsis atlantica TaxID=2614577 RepID=A0A9P8CPQ1_9HYPO|nr:uncharacterized protein F5Z01DRAFT_94492 [Emericellopsis atlantica]KAG9254788.1 hypothetical protein F5Z01DRAFT_94492 [Emericellopsis atlantica]
MSTSITEIPDKTLAAGYEPGAVFASCDSEREIPNESAYRPPIVGEDQATNNEPVHPNSSSPPTAHPTEAEPKIYMTIQQSLLNRTSGQSAAHSESHHDSTSPPPFKVCLDSNLAIPGTYYWHPGAPDFVICSCCYVDHIESSIFAPTMESRFFDVGEPRICRFSRPRMKDHLFPEALTTGSLRRAAEWMRRRATIQDCKGTNGVSGGQGMKWYKSRRDDIPSFVVCEACYEDHMAFQESSGHFFALPEDLHKPENTWACDLAIPYILRLWKKLGKDLTWDQFVAEAKGRMSFNPCPGAKAMSTYNKHWFVPKTGHEGLMVCAACWADHILLTGEDDKWRHAEELMELAGNLVRCSFSNMNVSMPMLKSHDEKDYSIFWAAMDKLSKTPPCEAKGIRGGKWWTLPSDPDNFQVCAACYTGLAETLGIDYLLIPKQSISPDDTLLCTLNPNSPRAAAMVQRFLQMYYNHDATSLENYAKVWARIPPCKVDEDYANGHWYGWLDCTICRECYHEFASKYPSMVAAMELEDRLLPNPAVCEMYSRRMRTLFDKTASDSSPPDLKPLLEFSIHRRGIYLETVPQMRMMVFQSRMGLFQQQSLNAQSSFYLNMGLGNETLYGSNYTYGAAGVGYGFANRDLLHAEQLRQQAMGIMGDQSSRTMHVGMLQEKWKAVE